ncbi:MAG: hypothetical protein LC725_08665 [Lentisphaerae bacterium]|nr:hypothetical protein [Lentisphaerota bacterium]
MRDKGRPEEALAILDKAHSDDVADIRSDYWAGRFLNAYVATLKKKEDYKTAIEHYRMILERDFSERWNKEVEKAIEELQEKIAP